MAAILSRPHSVFVFVFVFDELYLYLYLYLIRFLPVYLYLYLYLKLWKKNVFVFVFDKTYLTPALMRTQVALYFIMKWNLYRVVSLCLNKQNVQNRQVEKGLLL